MTFDPKGWTQDGTGFHPPLGGGGAGAQGKVGDKGPTGDPGPAGSGGSASFSQVSPAATWVITHALGFHPSVTIVDSGGTTVEGDITYDSLSQVTVRFTSAFSGTAYLS